MSGRLPDDTELDALAAVARAVPVLPDAEIERLLGDARGTPGGAAAGRLVEQTLGTVLQSVLARRAQAGSVELLDLYQEGAVAATVAVAEYATRGGAGLGLRPYVAKVVDRFLDEVLAAAEAQRVADALLVAQVELLQAAQVRLRRLLDRDPTVLELSGLLEWTPERVEVVRSALLVAAAEHDLDILQYLDDAEEAGSPY